MSTLIYDVTDTPSVPVNTMPRYGVDTSRGGKMNKTQVNTYAKHIAIAAAAVWVITKFV